MAAGSVACDRRSCVVYLSTRILRVLRARRCVQGARLFTEYRWTPLTATFVPPVTLVSYCASQQVPLVLTSCTVTGSVNGGVCSRPRTRERLSAASEILALPSLPALSTTALMPACAAVVSLYVTLPEPTRQFAPLGSAALKSALASRS